MLKTKEYLDNILDCFGGADGGVSFAKFRYAVEDLEKQAMGGDVSAKRIIEVVRQFSKLINVLGT